MKYLKKYKTFEMAVIIPNQKDGLIDELIEKRPSTIEHANNISNEYEVDILTHYEFTESVKDEEEDFVDNIPPKDKFIFTPHSGINFAILNKVTNRINIIVDYPKFIQFLSNCPPPLIDVIKSMLAHEEIHAQQFNKMGNDKSKYVLRGTPTSNVDIYLGHHTEIMAYAFSIVDELKKQGKNKEEILNIIKRGMSDPKSGGSWILGWYKETIKDPKVLNKLRKYAYLYANKLFDENKE